MLSMAVKCGSFPELVVVNIMSFGIIAFKLTDLSSTCQK
jgi:hypothetical protein